MKDKVRVEVGACLGLERNYRKLPNQSSFPTGLACHLSLYRVTNHCEIIEGFR